MAAVNVATVGGAVLVQVPVICGATPPQGTGALSHAPLGASLSRCVLPSSRVNGAVRALVASRRTFSSQPQPRSIFLMAATVEPSSADTAETEAPASEGTSESAPASEDASADPEVTFTNKLYVGNLPFSVDNIALGDAFGDFGSLQSAEVIYDSVSGRSKGYGFVTFATVDEAKSAQTELDGAEFGGRTIKVSFPQSKPRTTTGDRRSTGRDNTRGNFRERERESSGPKLYVGNLSWGIDDQSLVQLFQEFGKVETAKVVMDDTGRSKGFGFVSFSSISEAEDAMAQLDGQSVEGRPLRVNFAADKKRSPSAGRW